MKTSIGIAAAIVFLAGFSPAASAQDATINWAEVHQKVDGFGAAAAFSVYNSMTAAQADHFFSPTTGIGLSLLRIQINSDGTTDDLVTAQMAQARGARVWGTPWSPPAAWKSNGSTTNGGTLLPAHYQDWANSLTNFVKTMSANGVNIYAVSIQNEPDFVATYDSGQYNGQQFHDFIATLGPTFASNGIAAKIMLPETSSWDAMAADSDPSLLDPATAKYVGIAATHAYAGNTYQPYPNAQNQGIPLWETEVSDFNGYDGSIGSGINYAQQIHNCMVVAGCTAWHFWWLKATQGDNEGLQSSAGADSYRYWAMGNFARFVRPGMQRIGVSGSPAGVSVSAYKDPSTGNYAIVAVNSNFGAQTFNLILNGMNTTSMTPWETSSTFNLAAQHAIPVSGSSVSVTLDAQSITTFVGTASTGATAPTITTQPTSKAIAPGQTATFSVVASGTGTLTYQWQKNGVAISGATAASYTTPAAVAADNGSTFRAVVSNANGSATSSSATLTVSTSAAPGSQLIAINAGGGAVGTFVADTGFSGGTPYSTTNTVSTASAVSPAPAAVYQTERYGPMTYTLGGLTSGTTYMVRLHFAEVFWTAANQRLFNVSINGAAALTNFDIFTAAGGQNKAVIQQFNATANASGQIVVGFTVGGADQPKISGLEVTTAGSAAPPPAATAPTITTQPANQSVTAGATATFSVAASGTAPFSYQWTKGGAAISGATAASYTTPATTTADSGSVFAVVVTNSAGSATSTNATLTVTAATVAPSITTQPASQSVTAGATATFSVAASGTAPFTYQWTKNGAAISGATAASYTTPATTTADSGSTFAVKVSNSAGSATSTNATLTVTAAAPPPAGTQVIAIGSGSSAPASTYKADMDVSGGTMYTPNPTGTISTAGVTNPAPLAVYKNERYGAFTYTVPGLTPGATYNVRLHFVEIFWTAAGKRNFNVTINGTKVLSAFDIFSAAGGANKVTIQQFTATANASGQIVITYSNGTADQPKSSAIEITQ